MKNTLLLVLLFLFTYMVKAQTKENSSTAPVQINGVFPHISTLSDHKQISEAGIGALIPWANKLWMVGYVAHITGSGLGLYEISPDMSFRKHPKSVTGTFANRMVHGPSYQAIIGPHLIDSAGNVRTVPVLANQRLTATMTHLTNPDNMVYFLTMEGLLYEVNVHSLEAKQVADLIKELDIPESAQSHFKGGYTGNGRVVVANNTYDEREYLGLRQGGRLAEWDGKTWTVIDKNPYMEINGKVNNFRGTSVYGDALFATGWDKASVILKVFVPQTGKWETYRLPKGGQTFDHTWNTEWMRIREAQTERFIMDMHGILYELPMMTYGGKVWGIKPIANHLRIVPDFCFWRGMFVLAGDQTDHGVGQAQSGLQFMNIDDLWKWSKPKGWGGPWWEQEVKANETSDPYLMTGFDKKVLHISHNSAQAISFNVEVDFLGNGHWVTYKSFDTNGYKDVVTQRTGSYIHHEFPDGFSAHWVRIRVNKACKATAYFMYN